MSVVDRPRPTLQGFDPLSLEFAQDPYRILELARRERPVFFFEPLNVWVVTRYRDIAAAASDYQTFSSRAVRLAPPPPDLAHRLPSNPMTDAFICMDPPRHTVSRKSANRAFTRGRIASLEPSLRATAHELIDTMQAGGARTADLMTAYCYPLLTSIIVSLLGAPLSMADSFRQWTDDFMALLSPFGLDGEHPGGPARPMAEDELRSRWERIAEGHAYYSEFVSDRIAQPRDDLVSALLGVVDEGGEPALSPDCVVMHMTELIAAGNETTANQIGLMVMLFDEHPAQLELLRDEPSWWPNAVEEGMRRRSSGVGSFRITTREVELSGVNIPPSSLVYLMWISAGHDESEFPDPRRFDVRRANASKHLTLGRGRHLCMGAPLARLAARVGLQTLYDRIPRLAVTPGCEPSFQPNLTTIVLEHLQVSW